MGATSVIPFVIARQLVGNTLVALDAALSLLFCCAHFFTCTLFLAVKVHSSVRMTIAAFPGIRGQHVIPDPLGQLQPPGFEFFWRVYGSRQLVKEFVAGFYLA